MNLALISLFDEARFWKKVRRADENDCWEWQSTCNDTGYGQLSCGRAVKLKAHRVAFALANGGIIPDGAHILHHCDNPPCCNPRHLFAGTHKDNVQDMIKKGRGSKPPHKYGREHHNAKFDEAIALKIINDTRTLHVIAADYGVSSKTVFRLKHGQSWKRLDRTL